MFVKYKGYTKKAIKEMIETQMKHKHPTEERAKAYKYTVTNDDGPLLVEAKRENLKEWRKKMRKELEIGVVKDTESYRYMGVVFGVGEVVEIKDTLKNGELINKIKTLAGESIDLFEIVEKPKGK